MHIWNDCLTAFGLKHIEGIFKFLEAAGESLLDATILMW